MATCPDCTDPQHPGPDPFPLIDYTFVEPLETIYE